jgi:hypothetical protein
MSEKLQLVETKPIKTMGAWLVASDIEQTKTATRGRWVAVLVFVETG